VSSLIISSTMSEGAGPAARSCHGCCCIIAVSPPSHAHRKGLRTHLYMYQSAKVHYGHQDRSIHHVLKLKSLSITCSIARWYSSCARLVFHAAMGCSGPFPGILLASPSVRGLKSVVDEISDICWGCEPGGESSDAGAAVWAL
jgi:hypothetical protein